MNIKQPFLGPVGRCIYCGANNVKLGREHTLPKSLGGEGIFVVQEASCSTCSEITSRFERHVAREILFAARAKHRMPTKNKCKRPTHLPLSVQIGDDQKIIGVPIDAYPAVVPLLIFPPPGYLEKRPYSAGISVIGTTLGGPPIKEIRSSLNIDKFKVTVAFKPVYFARLLAKIAYGFSIITFGPSVIDTSYVRQAIINPTDDLGQWVGCVSEYPPEKTNNVHELKLSIKNDDIYVTVRLFANYQTPEYLVITGRSP